MNGSASFGRWLKLRRLALDLTQSELGQLVGCSAMTIRKIEADERRPSRQLAERFVQHLALPTEDRTAFLKAARAELSPDRLAAPIPPHDLSPARHPHNLPAALTPFIGRERQVSSLSTLLLRPNVRLLTLTGPGGVGKTRLGQQAAAQVRGTFTDGVWFVALAPIQAPELVVPTIAQVLGVKAVGDAPLINRLKEVLRDKRLLLVLDNFEHVAAVAPTLTELLAAAADLKILVTSRALLHLSGEHEFVVPPLDLPDPQDLSAIEVLAQGDAVALFIARAQAATAAFTLTPANAGAVAAICQRLDGLPLALELAAARVKLFPPQALLARLDNRLTFLTGGARDLAARQQTIRATIDWSYQLLDADEQALFARLGVFVGGFTLEAAQAICNAGNDLSLDVIDGIASVLDKSLLQRMGGMEGEPRFTMLETLREYALERLVEREEVEALRQAHATYYLALGQAAEPELRGPRQGAWNARLEQEHNNLRAVLAWSQSAAAPDDQAGALGARLAVAVRPFWSRRGHHTEGRRWLAGALPRVAADAAEPEARRLRARVLSAAGHLAVFQGDAVAGRALLEESLALFQELGDSWGSACVLLYLGFSYRQGDHGQAERLMEQSLASFRTIGDRWGIAWALAFLILLLVDVADSADAQDQSGRALVLLEESLAHFRAVGDLFGIGHALEWAGNMAAKHGDNRRARVLLAETLGLFREMGNKVGVLRALTEFAGLVAAQGQQRAELERAARLFGAAEALENRIIANPEFGIPNFDRAPQAPIAMLRAQLGAATFATAWAEGLAMTLEQAIAEAVDDAAEAPIT